jgi:hypothetical protein
MFQTMVFVPLLHLQAFSLFGVLIPKGEMIVIFISSSFLFHLMCNELKLYVCWSYGKGFLYVDL